MKKPNTIPESSNRFEFVTVASHRARQLLQGCTPRVEPEIKPARTALREVQVGAVKPAAPAGTPATESR